MVPFSPDVEDGNTCRVTAWLKYIHCSRILLASGRDRRVLLLLAGDQVLGNYLSIGRDHLSRSSLHLYWIPQFHGNGEVERFLFWHWFCWRALLPDGGWCSPLPLAGVVDIGVDVVVGPGHLLLLVDVENLFLLPCWQFRLLVFFLRFHYFWRMTAGRLDDLPRFERSRLENSVLLHNFS